MGEDEVERCGDGGRPRDWEAGGREDRARNGRREVRGCWDAAPSSESIRGPKVCAAQRVCMSGGEVYPEQLWTRSMLEE